jgi:hypothetical protein
VYDRLQFRGWQRLAAGRIGHQREPCAGLPAGRRRRRAGCRHGGATRRRTHSRHSSAILRDQRVHAGVRRDEGEPSVVRTTGLGRKRFECAVRSAQTERRWRAGGLHIESDGQPCRRHRVRRSDAQVGVQRRKPVDDRAPELTVLFGSGARNAPAPALAQAERRSAAVADVADCEQRRAVPGRRCNERVRRGHQRFRC